MERSGTILEIRDLKTHFYTSEGVVRAVDGVSLDVSAGETLALVGESGSGKSVTAMSVLGLVPYPGRVVGGAALFRGEDLLKAASQKMRDVRGKHIGIVFQEPMTSLNPVISIGEQIAEPLKVHLGMNGNAAHGRVLELLHAVGIRDGERRYRDYPHQFSGGMRQRVMIAMAMSCAPELLIADEPTTALDVITQAQILDTITRLARESSAALMIITHNLGIVARYAHRVNVMRSGKIVETGAAERVFSHPTHPYTQQLLDCVPRLDRIKRGK
ncbi:MAG: ABC transporter ATP-binding protein [Chloroflexi bacterium]|nr:ABC transporter ATP-binding protein [Chloroflexota bacterium]